MLLERGGEELVVARNAYGHLPVHLAAAMGHFEAVTTLLPDEPQTPGRSEDENRENSPEVVGAQRAATRTTLCTRCGSRSAERGKRSAPRAKIAARGSPATLARQGR